MIEHMDDAVELVLAMMRSASTDRINPKKWWTRAKSALETAAAKASDLSEMVSEMGRKLEIEVTTQATASSICSLTARVTDFEGFRRLCETQALYVVAIAQGEREKQREQMQTAEMPVADPFAPAWKKEALNAD